MSFCPNCGKELEGNPLFCPECGTYLMNATAAQQSAPQEPQPQPETYAQPQQQTEAYAQPEGYYQPPVQQQPQAQPGGYYQPPVQQQPQQQNQQYQQMPTYTVPPQQQYAAPSYAPPVEDKVKIGLAILSFFIPLVGWILFFKKRKTTPKAARVYGIVATVSFVIGIITTHYGESAYAYSPNTSSIVCEAGEAAPSYDGLFI